jgi:hypothetical protein
MTHIAQPPPQQSIGNGFSGGVGGGSRTSFMSAAGASIRDIVPGTP